LSAEDLDPESLFWLQAARERGSAIRREIARLQARKFAFRLPTEVLAEIAARAESHLGSLEALPDAPEFFSDQVPHDERLDSLATVVYELVQLHKLLYLLSRVHSSRLPFEIVRPFEGLAAQLLGVDSASLMLRPGSEYGFSINSWGGESGRSLLPGAKALANSFCVFCPSAEVSNFGLFAILGHELGHPVFQRRVVSVLAASALGQAVVEVAPEGTDPEVQKKATDVLGRWAEEMFCDLCGVRLFGPAFVAAYRATLPIIWQAEGTPGYPSSCIRLEGISAGLKRWWEQPDLAPVLAAFPPLPPSQLTCPVHEDPALKIAAEALAPDGEFLERLLSITEAEIPSPSSCPGFAEHVISAGERIELLIPPDPYLLAAEHEYQSHELVAFAFLSAGIGRQRANSTWSEQFGWSEQRCSRAVSELAMKGLEASDLRRRFGLES